MAHEVPIEEIMAAFHNDDAAALREVLAAHPELKARVNDPVFPFDSPAIAHVRSRAMLDVLLEAGADINGRSKWWAGGFGLMDFAGAELAQYAISRGAMVDVHAAARLGMIDRLRELISKDPTLVHARGGDGQTPLHFASSIAIAEFLLDHGAEIDARDIDHESTAAQYMVKDRQDVARYLVERGAACDLLMAAALGDLERVRKWLDEDPAMIRMNVSEEYFPKRDRRAGGTIYIWTLGANKTAHQVAREFGHEEVYRLLMERSPAELQLAMACATGDQELATRLAGNDRSLIAKMIDSDKRALANSAQANQNAVVVGMLKLGWPVDARGQHGGTALHWASFHGNRAMVEEILRYGPGLELKDEDHRATPLGWATYGSLHGWYRTSGDYAGVVELLCAAGAVVPEEISGTEAVKDVQRRFVKRV